MESWPRSGLAVVVGAIVGLALNLAGFVAFVLALQFLGVPAARLQAVPPHPAVVIGMFVIGLPTDVAAGWVAGKLARRSEVGHAVVAAVLVMVLGLGITLATGNQPTPAGLAGLALTIPMAMGGGVLARWSSDSASSRSAEP